MAIPDPKFLRERGAIRFCDIAIDGKAIRSGYLAGSGERVIGGPGIYIVSGLADFGRWRTLRREIGDGEEHWHDALGAPDMLVETCERAGAFLLEELAESIGFVGPKSPGDPADYWNVDANARRFVTMLAQLSRPTDAQRHARATAQQWIILESDRRRWPDAHR